MSLPIPFLTALMGGGAPEPEPEPLPSLDLPNEAALPYAPSGSMPTPPAPDAHGTGQIRGMDLVRDLMPLIMSAVAGARNPAHGAAIARGFAAGGLHAQRERLAAQEHDESMRKVRADFMRQTAADVMRIPDPIQRQQYLELAHDIGVEQFGLSPQWTKKVPAHQAGEDVFAKLKGELAGQLAAFDKNARWKDVAGTPAEAKISFRLSSGQTVPVNKARALVGQAVYDSGTGAQTFAPPPVVKPEKKTYQHVEAIVAGRRRFVNFDPTTGKYFDPQTGAEVQATPAPSKAADASAAAGAGGAPGGLDEDGLEYASTLFRLTNTMPSLGMGKTPDRGRIINRAAAQAKALGQSPAAAIQRTYLYKADAKSLDRISLLASTAQAAESKAVAQVGIIRELSGKVKRTQYPIINRAILSGQTSIAGDPDATALMNAISTFANEYGKIIEGSTGSVSGASESARRTSEKLVNAAMNPKQLETVLDLMEREMGLTLQGWDVTRNEISKRMGGGGVPNAPDTPQAPLSGNQFKSGRFTVTVGGGG